jgi:hypothetical protein
LSGSTDSSGSAGSSGYTPWKTPSVSATVFAPRK